MSKNNILKKNENFFKTHHHILYLLLKVLYITGNHTVLGIPINSGQNTKISFR